MAAESHSGTRSCPQCSVLRTNAYANPAAPTSHGLLPVPTRLARDYFHVSMKVRHADQFMASGPLCDLEGYLRKNAAGIINYREWRRVGRRISTSAVEGTVNRLIGRRMCKSQQMCWTNLFVLLIVYCFVERKTIEKCQLVDVSRSCLWQ